MIKESFLTSSLTGVRKDDDVIEGPGVVGVRRVEGELGCPLRPQGHQEGGVDHGDAEAAPALAVLGGEVLSCAAVVALGKGALWPVRGPLYPKNPAPCRSTQTPRPPSSLLSVSFLPQPHVSWGPLPGLTCGVIPHQKLE